MAAGLRSLLDWVYGFMAVIMLLGSVFGTFQWVVEHSRKHSPRAPEWVGTLYFWLWVAWAGFLATLLVPQVFNLSSLVDLYRGRDFAWLLPALIWSVGALAAPAALLFAGRWALARAQRKRRERERDIIRQWQKFEAIGHRLNWKQVFSIPAVITYDDDDNHVTTTVGKVLNEILPGRFNLPGEPTGEKAPVPESEKPFLSGLRVKAPNGRTIEIETIRSGGAKSARFASELVEGILQLFRITESVGDCLLFFHEHDRGHHDTTWWENYDFFVVYEDTIVLERFKLSSLCDDFFDRTVLKSMYEKEDWQKDDDEEEDTDDEEAEDDGELTPGQKTFQRWWYRRFYTETKTGQMKVFWNEPLFNYVPPERRETERDARLRRVEWVVLGIAGFLVAHYVFKLF